MILDFDRLDAFWEIVLTGAASDASRLAVWLDQSPGSLPIGEPCGPASPFGSGSRLAGEGMIFDLTIANARRLLNELKEPVLWRAIHVEIEQNGRLILQTYDHFEVLLAGNLPEPLIDSLQKTGVITNLDDSQ